MRLVGNVNRNTLTVCLGNEPGMRSERVFLNSPTGRKNPTGFPLSFVIEPVERVVGGSPIVQDQNRRVCR